MGLRDRMYELTEVSELDEFLERFPTSAIFKAGACHKTSQGFGYVEQALNPYGDLHMAFVRVIDSRPVSNAIAERTEIVHQSPQLIFFVDGKAVFDIDNWDITLEDVTAAAAQHFGPVKADHESQAVASGDVSKYVELLEGFISGSLSAHDFELKWLTTFQQDATPRTTQEFDLLNRLFGDVDEALSGGLLQPGAADPLAVMAADPTLKKRAGELLEAIKA